MAKKKPIVKPWEELTISDDYMFKLVMRHKRFCKKLIEKILDIKIKRIVYLEDEKTMKFRYAGKGIRLDVYVEGDDTVYDIEMQVRDYGDEELAYRTRYYQSMIDVDALAQGVSYTELKKSFIIFLCPFAMFDGKRHRYTFRNLCIEDTNLILNDGTTKIFLCSEGTMDDVSPDIKAFLDYMKGLSSSNGFVNELDALVKEIKSKEEERVSYMTYEMKMREAHEDGKAEGVKKGRKEMAVEMAINMLRENEPLSKIVKYTNLSQARIEKLSAGLQN